MNTNTHFHTHTLDLHAKFEGPRVKTVAAKEWEIFVDRRQSLPMTILTAYEQFQISASLHVFAVHLSQGMD